MVAAVIRVHPAVRDDDEVIFAFELMQHRPHRAVHLLVHCTERIHEFRLGIRELRVLAVMESPEEMACLVQLAESEKDEFVLAQLNEVDGKLPFDFDSLRKLVLERERIESSKTRDVLDVERRKIIEIAEQDRSIEIAAKLTERADADRRVKEADIVAAQQVGRIDVVREQTLDLARLERRRAVEQFEIARGQALQEAEIAAREEVERARIASERGIDEARILRDRELRQLEIARETAVENARMESSIEIHRKSREQSAAQAGSQTARC